MIIHQRQLFLNILLVVAMFVSISIPLRSQAIDFGKLEAPLPGLGSDSIGDIIKGKTPIVTYMSFIIKIITALIVIAGLISIIVGAYFYMTAGGDSGRMGTGKTFIASALLGIALALTAYLILNTISGQYASQLKEPVLPAEGK